ncbi:hypothetical protein BCR39DRAFT_515654 [Naematelia encephala]|uniref:Uncharacterized protein n=1 Tax=Naematelia encephala TaxID=71784 RepID=A0A1Y2BJI0_9TREE|nr:hypothetical protein BCR39DRAFT_515654 [Naematelia encephala]
MTSRPHIVSHQSSSSRSRIQSQPSPSSSFLAISRTPSGPGTPRQTRGDIPSRKGSTTSTSRQHPPIASQPFMVDQPFTPPPRKPGRRRKLRNLDIRNSEQRDVINADEHEPSSEDEETLFDLLGVQSPKPNLSTPSTAPSKGILPISKSIIEDSKQRNGRRVRPSVESDPEADRRPLNDLKAKAVTPTPDARAAKRNATVPPDREVLSEGDALHAKDKADEGEVNIKKTGRANRNGRKQKQLTNGDSPAALVPEPRNAPSGISSSRPAKNKAPKQLPLPLAVSKIEHVFETESLSKSLPSGDFMSSLESNKGGNRKGKKAGSENESAVWEMPDGAGPTATQELTWQQRLESSAIVESPHRNKQSTSTDRKTKTRSVAAPPNQPSRLNPRPSHTRRASLDMVPAATASTPQTRSFSALDDSDPQPWHTSFNANRAPQTPAKISTSRPVPVGASLPLINGDFPRLNKGPVAALSGSFGAEKGGSMYAGPTFHNSPSAASLPKPDMDDF